MLRMPMRVARRRRSLSYRFRSGCRSRQGVSNVADQDTDTQDKIPFTAHLEELSKRLITCFVAVGIGFALSYGFKEKLFQILTQPLISVMKQGETLIYTGLPEAFFTFLKVSFLAGTDGCFTGDHLPVLDVCCAGTL
jgi:hypothetical protein